MAKKMLRASRVLVLLAASMPALAQYVATPPPNDSPGAPRAEELRVYPKNGQTQEQQWSDRYECHRWATTQSGFDPTRQVPGAPPENAAGREGYRRALTACLEGRGYTVRFGAPPAPAPPPPPAPTTRTKQYSSSKPGLGYHPITAQIEGGYTVAAGDTSHFVDDGSNVGFGLTWFPTSALPFGVRVDGSYSYFRAKDALLNQFGGGWTSGHQHIYGGDVDLQVDLAHESSWVKMYLLGGAGWYRVQTHLRQVSAEQGLICDPYFCEPGYFPVLTAVQRTTSPWHSSWNAGFGIEIATSDITSFFIEARYLRIAPSSSKMQFVPIRIGLRF
jgi:Outer membrane protein beta-barrel domain